MYNSVMMIDSMDAVAPDAVIVVEGRHDAARVREAVAARVYVLGGDALTPDKIKEIACLHRTRGVIVLTDPDRVGEKLRRALDRAIPGLWHAHLAAEEARKGESIGVEHASLEAIRRALRDARPAVRESPPPLSWEAYIDLGLAFGPEASRRRARLAARLGIGSAGAKSFYERLCLFRIDREALFDALSAVASGEVDVSAGKREDAPRESSGDDGDGR
ncbi:MAG: ribonuclease M5 [Hydrogenibacillus sp.]|nr:ribonuclease M5 [Hydrogenibacillus sp.]